MAVNRVLCKAAADTDDAFLSHVPRSFSAENVAPEEGNVKIEKGAMIRLRSYAV